MPIYEAEFLGDPTPIKKPRAPRKPKQPKEGIESTSTIVPPPIEKGDDVPAPAPVVKVGRRVKNPIPIGRDNSSPPPPAKKRKVSPKKKEQEPSPPPSDVSMEEEIVVPKPKKVHKKKAKALPVPPTVIIDGKSVDDPPSWFKNYLLDEAKRRNENREKKQRQPLTQVKKDATEVANQKWNDGLTRDRVNNEVTTHMNKLYQQIHGGKRR